MIAALNPNLFYLRTVAIRRMILDYDRQLMSIVLADGQIHVEPSTVRPDGADVFRRAEVDVAERELHLRLRDQTDLTLEFSRSPRDDHPSPDRAVIYLDQNHWRTIADALDKPGSLDPMLERAALDLTQLAAAKSILLPLSSAHGFETVRTDGRLRWSLAKTMLRVSRGWQMSDPIRVRKIELGLAIAGKTPVATGVFTLDPAAYFADNLPPQGLPVPVPEWMREQHRRIVAVQAFAAALLDDEPMTSTEARRMATGWAKSHKRLAMFLHEDRASGRRRHVTASLAVLFDLQAEIAEISAAGGYTAEYVSNWLESHALDDVCRMPYLGRLQRVLADRLSNPAERWHGNDLVDAHFLSCATGYADVVVAERRHAAALCDRDSEGRAAVFRTLPEAVAHLRTGARP